MRNWHSARSAKALVEAGNSAWDTLSRDFPCTAVGAPIVTADLGARILARLLARQAANDA